MGASLIQAGKSILTGGTIVDGTGAPSFQGQVVIRNGRIVSVGEARDPGEGAEFNVIDCKGCVIVPGFIDAHSHSDLQVLENRPEKLLQGVTAEVVGNCGFSPYPLPEDPNVLREFANGILCGDDKWGWNSASNYLSSASQSKVATVASLVGHGSLRINVVGNTSRMLTSREIDTMVGRLDELLQEGAAGFSSGLMYAPGSGASPEELIALCRVVARRGKVYATHMRSYSAGLVVAVQEQLAIAEASGCRLQVSHLQAAGEDYWPLQQLAIAAIEAASERGVDVAFDAYPWLAGSTVLTQVLPQDALDGGLAKLLSRIADPLRRESIRSRIKPEARWNGVVITSAAKNADSIVGRSVQDIANERGTDPEDTVLGLLAEQEGNVNIVEHCQSTENLHTLLTHPLCTVITDGVYTKGRSHPRLYATFPLLFEEMVRKRGWLSLEEAVHKVTGKPAMTFHMDDRGRIAEGYVADVTVFDPETIHTNATYEMPDVAPTGIRAVLRTGNMVVDAGKII
jgi:N-acyl-D-amino-acid deacylase